MGFKKGQHERYRGKGEGRGSVELYAYDGSALFKQQHCCRLNAAIVGSSYGYRVHTAALPSFKQSHLNNGSLYDATLSLSCAII